MNRSTPKVTQQDNIEQENMSQEAVNRRSFLKGVAVAGTAVGSGALTSQTLAKSAVESAKPTTNAGYQETDHIREYYRLARF